MITKHPKGFIALMSAVIISAVLLGVALTGSVAGFLERGNNLSIELKQRSYATAEACYDQALLKIAASNSYVGTSTYVLNQLDSCRVAVWGASNKFIRVQATSSGLAITNLQITFSTTTSSILFWQEVAVF